MFMYVTEYKTVTYRIAVLEIPDALAPAVQLAGSRAGSSGGARRSEQQEPWPLAKKTGR